LRQLTIPEAIEINKIKFIHDTERKELFQPKQNEFEF